MSVISMERPRRRRFARAGGRLIWIAGLAAVLAGATYKLGILPALLVLAGLLAVPLLLNNARAALTVWITFLLLRLAAVAALLDIRPGVKARLPDAFVPALVLVSIAVAFGFVTGAL